MTDVKFAQPMPCNEVGTLIFKNHCYALLKDDGVEMWLELDLAPPHLIDRAVEVQGEMYSHRLMCVDRIGPAN
jgi:hypothetical protein